jgi:hypothetical protein
MPKTDIVRPSSVPVLRHAKGTFKQRTCAHDQSTDMLAAKSMLALARAANVSWFAEFKALVEKKAAEAGIAIKVV